MKRIFFLLLISLLSLTTRAQELTIKSFEQTTSLDGKKYARLDANDTPCALIKVQLARQGAVFEGNVVGDVAYKMSEYWVYMYTGSTKTLTVKVEGALPLRVYFPDYGIDRLQPNSTYNLVLMLPVVNDSQAEEQILVVDFQPVQAMLIIDSQPMEDVRDGHAELKLPVGPHDYMLVCSGYSTAEGTIKLRTDSKGRLNLQLEKKEKPASTVTSNLQSSAGATTQTLTTTVVGTSSSDPFNGHSYVDLGLKDAEGRTIYWATCNVGGSKPEDAGLYFAWGETQGYGSNTSDGHKFDWAHYTLCNGKKNKMKKYCTDSQYGAVDSKTVLAPEDDAAHVQWGGSWRMSTRDEQDQLRTQCTWTWDSTKKGYTVKGPNGQSIFLPAAGFRDGSGLSGAGSYGYYWSSSLDASNSSNANYLFFGSSLVDWDDYYRYGGQSVRAVCVSSE